MEPRKSNGRLGIDIGGVVVDLFSKTRLRGVAGERRSQLEAHRAHIMAQVVSPVRYTNSSTWASSLYSKILFTRERARV